MAESVYVLLVPPSAVEMEENAIGLRLQQGSVSESVDVSVQTAVLRCLYWLEETEMWWDHGCEVRSKYVHHMLLRTLTTVNFVRIFRNLTASA